MGKIDAVIFDLDGVITDSAEYHYLAWRNLAEELSIPFDRNFNEQLKGLSRVDSLELILARGDNKFTAEERERLAEKKNEHYKLLIKEIDPKDLLPGIESFMKEVKAQGIKTALASASKNAPEVIERLEITHLLDTVVDAAKVGKGKPDPEVFLTAALQLGVTPENCVGVEDAVAGVAAIKSAGMYAVGIGDKEQLSQADWVVSDSSQLSLAELKKRL